MRQLLRHLNAHRNTVDPWILVYDSRGTFSDAVGNLIQIDNWSGGAASMLGTGLRIFKTVPDAMEVRVRRANLESLIVAIGNALRNERGARVEFC